MEGCSLAYFLIFWLAQLFEMTSTGEGVRFDIWRDSPGSITRADFWSDLRRWSHANSMGVLSPVLIFLWPV